MAALGARRDGGRAGLAGSCASLLVVFPIAAPLLPAAVANEWDAAPKIAFHWTWLLPAVPLGRCSCWTRRGRRLAAVATVVCATAAGLTYLKVRSEPEMARIASARELAAEARLHPGEVCAGDLKRDWQYGLNYYAGTVLPSCETKPIAIPDLTERRASPPEAGSDRTGTGSPPNRG